METFFWKFLQKIFPSVTAPKANLLKTLLCYYNDKSLYGNFQHKLIQKFLMRKNHWIWWKRKNGLLHIKCPKNEKKMNNRIRIRIETEMCNETKERIDQENMLFVIWIFSKKDNWFWVHQSIKYFLYFWLTINSILSVVYKYFPISSCRHMWQMHLTCSIKIDNNRNEENYKCANCHTSCQPVWS